MHLLGSRYQVCCFTFGIRVAGGVTFGISPDFFDHLKGNLNTKNRPRACGKVRCASWKSPGFFSKFDLLKDEASPDFPMISIDFQLLPLSSRKGI